MTIWQATIAHVIGNGSEWALKERNAAKRSNNQRYRDKVRILRKAGLLPKGARSLGTKLRRPIAS